VLSRENGIWPQRDVIKYIRSAIALDGLIKTFSPGMDIGRHLEQACERHIRWDAVHNLISPDTFTGWFGGYAHLLRDGFLRGLNLLTRSGANAARPDIPYKNRNETRSHRAKWLGTLQIAWIAICMAIIWRPARITPIHVVASVAVFSTIIWQSVRHSRHSRNGAEQTRN